MCIYIYIYIDIYIDIYSRAGCPFFGQDLRCMSATHEIASRSMSDRVERPRASPLPTRVSTLEWRTRGQAGRRGDERGLRTDSAPT